MREERALAVGTCRLTLGLFGLRLSRVGSISDVRRFLRLRPWEGLEQYTWRWWCFSFRVELATAPRGSHWHLPGEEPPRRAV